MAAPCPASDRIQASATPKVCLIYATLGRAEVLSQTYAAVARQTIRPASVIVSCATIADAGDLAGFPDVKVVIGGAGLASQRNRALAELPEGTEIVVFFDDDFVPHVDWIAEVVRVFQKRPDVGAVTGNLIADGIKLSGIPADDAFAMVEQPQPAGLDWVEEPYSPYGCNMAYRVSMIQGLLFDERLVLYGWLEDRDFGAALARRGAKLVRVGSARGVHMGVKRGRVSGVKLGYSQIVNPVYLRRKGTMRSSQVLGQIFRNTASNLAKVFKPEPYIDRVGRLRGNVLGMRDLIGGRLAPERAAKL